MPVEILWGDDQSKSWCGEHGCRVAPQYIFSGSGGYWCGAPHVRVEGVVLTLMRTHTHQSRWHCDTCSVAWLPCLGHSYSGAILTDHSTRWSHDARGGSGSSGGSAVPVAHILSLRASRTESKPNTQTNKTPTTTTAVSLAQSIEMYSSYLLGRRELLHWPPSIEM